MKIGLDMINMELLSFEQAEAVLEYQMEHPSMKFGEIAEHLGFISREELESFLESHRK